MFVKSIILKLSLARVSSKAYACFYATTIPSENARRRFIYPFDSNIALHTTNGNRTALSLWWNRSITNYDWWKSFEHQIHASEEAIPSKRIFLVIGSSLSHAFGAFSRGIIERKLNWKIVSLTSDDNSISLYRIFLTPGLWSAAFSSDSNRVKLITEEPKPWPPQIKLHNEAFAAT